MSWIDNVLPPKIRSFLGNSKRETPENLWVKDPESGEMVFYRDLEANQWVVPGSGHHMKIKAADRLAAFLDEGKYDLVPLPSVPQDPLKFRDQKRYVDRLKDMRIKTADDAASMGRAADGVAVGTALCNAVLGSLVDGKATNGTVAAVTTLVSGLASGVRRARA